MSKFIIDANLPFQFSFWKGSEFTHVAKISNANTDNEIWEIAKTSNLTIVTKDSDFAFRVMSTNPPPKVIHFRINNMRIREFFEFIKIHWVEILKVSENHKLTNVYIDRIEGIN